MAASGVVEQLADEETLEELIEQKVEKEVKRRVAKETADLRKELHEEREARQEVVEELRRERSQQLARDKNTVVEKVEDVRQDLINEQKTRSRADSEMEQRITTLADEVGVDDLDTALAGEDKLVQLVRNGPDAVIGGRVYPVHKRVRKLLLNASDWGRVVSDKNGQRVQFVAPTVKPYLDAEFNRDFKTSEIERIFDKVVDLAGDSPRQVRKGKTSGDCHRLSVWLVDGALVKEAE